MAMPVKLKGMNLFNDSNSYRFPSGQDRRVGRSDVRTD